MISKDPKWGLLNLATHREVEDTAEPNLLREVFPYTDVPRIIFDGRSVPMEPAAGIHITDTTFRDGQQARPPYTVEQIVKLYDMLSRLGGPNGVIRASEFFLYSERDKQAVAKCLELGHRYPEVTGWIRATKEDFQLVKDMGLKETGILTSASDYHIFLKFKKTRAQILHHYLDLVLTALEAGLDAVRCHLEDITRADFDGFIIPYVQKLMELAGESGKVIKIRLCDTMGYGVPYPEAALPRGIPKMVHTMVHECGVPKFVAGVARAQRLPQGHGQRHHGVALRMRRRKLRAAWLRRAHGQPAAGGSDYGLHFPHGRYEWDRYARHYRDSRIFPDRGWLPDSLGISVCGHQL